ncbi:unnamed protein product, partial [marine sediment metagenome]
PLGHPSIGLNILHDELQARNSVISSFFLDIKYYCEPEGKNNLNKKGGFDKSNPYVNRWV